MIKLFLKNTLLILWLLLLGSTGVLAEPPPRLDFNIDLEETLEEFINNAPSPLKPILQRDAKRKYFSLRNVDPHIIYQGKEVVFPGAQSVILSYQESELTQLSIHLTRGAESIPQIKERFKALLPFIDALGFQRNENSKLFSAENLPLPETYQAEKGNSIKWESKDGEQLLRLRIGVPLNPEIYINRKHYLIDFLYSKEWDPNHSKHIDTAIREKAKGVNDDQSNSSKTNLR